MKPISRIDADISQRAELAIAHGALTNSKRPASFVKGVYPTHLARGRGCFVWDTKGNRYVDFICGLGSNILGYANEEITEAITEQARKGATLSLGTDLEVRAAERVKELFPFIEKLRFLKTGSDACTAACIIARAWTEEKRHKNSDEIQSEGYHGWHPEFTSLTEPANGICGHQWIEKLDWTLNTSPEFAAGVIIEPIITDSSPKRIDWLKTLRAQCDREKTALIFDETITGFRFPGFSIAKAHGITPDLICLGKAIANGMPLSVIGGKAELMDGDYFVSSTFAGETLSLAAAIKTMELLQTKYSLEILWQKGQGFLDRFNELAHGVVQLEGYPTRSKFTGEPLQKALFFQEACKAGILLGPSFFLCFPHLEVLDEVLSSFSDIVLRIKTGSVKLEGEAPVQPFAERVRQ